MSHRQEFFTLHFSCLKLILTDAHMVALGTASARAAGASVNRASPTMTVPYVRPACPTIALYTSLTHMYPTLALIDPGQVCAQTTAATTAFAIMPLAIATPVGAGLTAPCSHAQTNATTMGRARLAGADASSAGKEDLARYERARTIAQAMVLASATSAIVTPVLPVLIAQLWLALLIAPLMYETQLEILHKREAAQSMEVAVH